VTDTPRRLVTIAAINGSPARLLAAIMPLSEVESRLDAAGITGPHREATLDAWRAVIAAGELHVAAASGTLSGQAAAASADSQRDSITTMEAATMLNLSTRRTRQLAASGELPGHQVAGRWLFNVADVTAYEQRRRKAR